MFCILLWFAIISSSSAWTEIGAEQSSVLFTSYPDHQCDNKNDDGTDIHCYGKALSEIPKNLSTSLIKLTITDCIIVHISKNSFDPYREQIRDITLSNMPYLRVIEEGTFANMTELRTLYISYAPQVRFLYGLLRGVTSTTFYSLRIVWTRLTEIPDLVDLPTNNTMFLLKHMAVPC
nr:uncharacterized protein LOC111515973 [Leptinotarsa decemlineata]